MDSPKERDLFFYDQVDQATVGDITKDIIEINTLDRKLEISSKAEGFVYKPKPINIYIDSYGVNVYQILGLIGVIDKSITPIHTICTGTAMFAGFILLISGHKRFGYKYCTPMYHQIGSFVNGTVQEIKETASEAERLQSLFEKITLDKTKITSDRLHEVREKKLDWYMDADNALELGVIDEIL